MLIAPAVIVVDMDVKQPAAHFLHGLGAVLPHHILVKDLVDSVCIYPDRLTVQVAGAPPFVVALDEVGLKKGGITVVSEAGPQHCSVRGVPLWLSAMVVPPWWLLDHRSAAPVTVGIA